MEYCCSKCNVKLTKSILYNGYDFMAVKADAKFSPADRSAIIPYVCSNCGYVEWYAEQPEKFK